MSVGSFEYDEDIEQHAKSPAQGLISPVGVVSANLPVFISATLKVLSVFLCDSK